MIMMDNHEKYCKIQIAMTNIQGRTCLSENAPLKMNVVFSSVTPDMYNVDSDR